MSLMNKLPCAWERLIHHGQGWGSDRAGYFRHSLQGGSASHLSCPLCPGRLMRSLAQSWLLPSAQTPAQASALSTATRRGTGLCPLCQETQPALLRHSVGHAQPASSSPVAKYHSAGCAYGQQVGARQGWSSTRTNPALPEAKGC